MFAPRHGALGLALLVAACANPPIVVPAAQPAVATPLGIVTEPPADRSTYVALPDGTFAPALNGAVSPPPMQWPKDRPFAAIVGKAMGPDGNEWYVHADGTRSSTIRMLRSDLGDDTVTLVATPLQ